MVVQLYRLKTVPTEVKAGATRYVTSFHWSLAQFLPSTTERFRSELARQSATGLCKHPTSSPNLSTSQCDLPRCEHDGLVQKLALMIAPALEDIAPTNGLERLYAVLVPWALQLLGMCHGSGSPCDHAMRPRRCSWRHSAVTVLASAAPPWWVACYSCVCGVSI